jgi:MbtH protein
VSEDFGDEDRRIYVVVMNHEEQYSLWLASRPIPSGWRNAGFQGLKSECLAHIDRVWTDMRPLSLRKAMEREASLVAKQSNET